MKRLFTASISAAALLLAIGTTARAAPLPPGSVAWTYNWAPGAPSVPGYNVKDDGTSVQTGNVQFSNEETRTAVGSSDIVATNLRLASGATASQPDLVTKGDILKAFPKAVGVPNADGSYSLSLQLGTNVDGTPYNATLKFNGKLGGTFSAESANVTNMFGGNGKQSVNLGAYKFSVSLVAYTPPGPPDQKNAGSISAHVEITAIHPAGVPEPSTMLLCGLGASVLGGAAWRRQRKHRLAQA